MTSRKKIFIAFGLMVLLVIVSISLFIGGRHWYYGLFPLIPILPYRLISDGLKWAKNMVKRKVPEIPIKQPNLITSISVLLLKDFIQCVVYKNLSVLGEGTDEQRKKAFESIMSQYHEARGDEATARYYKLLRQMKDIELHKMLVYQNAEVLHERPSCEVAAGMLRKLYPNYPFTIETYAHDLGMVGKALIAEERKYTEYEKQVKSWESKNSAPNTQTPEQKEMGYVQRIMDFHQHLHMRYDMLTMTTLEYALAENRLTKYIESLNTQTRKHGRPN